MVDIIGLAQQASGGLGCIIDQTVGNRLIAADGLAVDHSIIGTLHTFHNSIVEHLACTGIEATILSRRH